ncbi:MAG: valine--tRNA ligase [Deltaproteobacteria bacterium]|nr:valine--tRNA ligase [Deltaproteobacteria bacterium]MDQ3300749.1 valine--tRNA ligase [Myxococcota bacterium]
MTTTTALSKQYDPSEVEPRWFRFWNENGFFHADETSPTVPYSITLPPPNVTGSLHMGHALGSTLQDILIRWKRMQGFNAMWMPGTDHASIAVHVLIEKDLKRRENKTRFDLGRDEFMKRAWAWKERSGNRIIEQEKLMGFSLDWARERFTMDEKSNRAVQEAFVRLHEEGLIFRAKRMINWDYASQTVVSDLEVDTVEENGSLWELKYPLADGSGEIIVATTRPETMLGDTAVAVHPSDERYKHLHGKEVLLPLTDRRIPIVAVELIRDGKPWPDPAFGSGAVKVTPAHDPNDYDASQAVGLPILQVIDKDGKLMAPAPAKYVGMSVDDARKAVVEDLEAGGFLGVVKPYKVPRGRSQRSGVVIEPMLMEQWFVKAAPLAEKAIAAVEAGKTKFVPELHVKTFMHWMTNIQDWCISRQLWWGHRIPAWYCQGCQDIVVARAAPTGPCGKCGGALVQDEDILDTWFSSALWPFSTLGWPDKPRELNTFYPNNVLVTGPDIIFFWVARMMMFGLHFMGKVPFRTVYLTAIVTDEDGKKMSKTKGNVIDPLDVVYGATLETLLQRVDVEKPPGDHDSIKKAIRKSFGKGIPPMGSDALRFALAILNNGSHIRLSVERVETYRNFINKLWNASRFALMNLDGYDPERFESQVASSGVAGRASLGMPERWILSRLQAACAEVDAALEAFQFSKAANAIYHFIYDELCDWYIELAKPHLYQGPELEQDPAKANRRHVVQGVLASALETTLRLLHPFAPYVTEEIWQKLPKPPQLPGSLMITVFPRADASWVDAGAEAEMQLVQNIAVSCRMLRATYNVPPTQRIEVEIRVASDAVRAQVEKYLEMIERAAKIHAKVGDRGGAPLPGAAKAVVSAEVEVVMPLGGLIDVGAEKARIKKDIAKAEKEIATIEKKLENPDFIAKAKEGVVDEQRTRLTDEQTRRQRLVDALETLGAAQ